MTSRGWFKLAECEPGTELFRSERRFKYWAHTISHGQTLFRGETLVVDGRQPADTRLDLLFKPTAFLKIRQIYDGLVVRVPTEIEGERIEREIGGINHRIGDRALVLESAGGISDYVVAMAFGWAEDDGDGLEISPFASPIDHDGPPWTRRDLFGVDGGIHGSATPEQLASALASPDAGAGSRSDYRYVWALMNKFNAPAFSDIKARPIGIFLTREEAEEERQRQIDTHPVKDADWWVESTPIAI